MREPTRALNAPSRGKGSRGGGTTYRAARQARHGAAPSAAAARGSWTTPKRLIWTGAFAAVTIVGSIYGVGLKTQQEYHEEKKQILESPVEERIQALEARRAQLVNLRRPLEQKREELLLRIQQQKQQQESGGSEPGETPDKSP
ncbi:hypothetical protein F5Y14DRAFT_81555 [Nemania sp. NC0429]|nr:hypothetical protein F5Y14DRAFT_81555 [Nemania sp. NC0429]